MEKFYLDHDLTFISHEKDVSKRVENLKSLPWKQTNQTKQTQTKNVFVQQIHMHKCHLFCAGMHQHVPYATQLEDYNNGPEP